MTLSLLAFVCVIRITKYGCVSVCVCVCVSLFKPVIVGYVHVLHSVVTETACLLLCIVCVLFVSGLTTELAVHAIWNKGREKV